jgi:D-sedoheptulose 7-phosphate isomerase
VSEAAIADLVAERAEARAGAGRRFFAREEERLALLCRELAARFTRGGRLLAIAGAGAARSDAEHVAVEFVHPVIVGKRALPAQVVGATGGTLVDAIRAEAGADDVVVGFGAADDVEVREALAAGARCGALSVGFGGVPADWGFVPGEGDPFSRQEILETAYHVLWELVHVFLDHEQSAAGEAGDASFLYPFLDAKRDQAADVDDLLADVRASVRAKSDEIAALRERTLCSHRAVLAAAAGEIATALDAGGRVLAFGNGGSATDAADFVADLRNPPAPPDGDRLAPRRALDLSAAPAVITAIANDVGVAEVFRRQLEAHSREGDVAVAISTSGDSENLCAALAAARAGGMVTLALVGSGGGRIAAEGLAEHLVVVPSDYVPRVQEAQASVLHVLRELIER